MTIKPIARLWLPLATVLLLAGACSEGDPQPGVSRDLARERSARVSQLSYTLCFQIPEAQDSVCRGMETIDFELSGREPLQLDFRPGTVDNLTVNGKSVKADTREEHIVLKGLKQGHNSITLSFTPEDAPLNRHPDYLYTLLVPDRARTLFPCFDQPDLKARFSLQLDLPESWVAVANAPVDRDVVEDGRHTLSFEQTELLSTYLFSFAAGRWDCISQDGISIYYRETDPAKLAQLPEIYRQIRFAMDWMEDFTGIPMPFRKYDCVVVPGFQFGGMEHPGAILFNDKRIFLPEAPTDAQKLSRIDLITHETAHLWFGDAVTMQWFDDVWTKEVFANHFAALMTRPLFPEVDYRLRDFRAFHIPAYAEDRTAGSNPIRQRLDNLQDAGLVYGNIVYDKAPVVMRMLSDTLGADAFRAGMREYLNTYLYRNATWPDLIAILDAHTPADLKAWSHRWVEEKGMPEHPESDSLPNLDAMGYGYYPMTDHALQLALEQVCSLPQAHSRLSTLANLYENMLRGRLEPSRLLDGLDRLLRQEKDPLVAASALSYLGDLWSFSGHPDSVETLLLDLSAGAEYNPQIRLQAFRSLLSVFHRPKTVDALYSIWDSRKPWPGLALSEDDYSSLSLELAIRLPDQYTHLRDTQLARLSNADSRTRLHFIFPSVSPSREVRDSVFNALLIAENRISEPWVQESLRMLNHPLREAESLDYIIPGLDQVQEIQRSGDIFFPKNWTVALLSGHSSPEAAGLVREWLLAHPDYPPLLLNKILQAADRLLR